MRRLGILITICLLAGSSARQSPYLKEVVVTETAVYAVLPPEAIASHSIRHVEWSPTGQFLLMVEESPRVQPSRAADALLGKFDEGRQQRLLVWNRLSGKTQNLGPTESLFGDPEVVFDSKSDEDGGLPIHWVGKSDVGLIEVSSISPVFELEATAKPLEIRRLDLTAGNVQTMRYPGAQVGKGWYYSLDKSPTTSKFVVTQTCLLRLHERGAPLQPADFRTFAWTVEIGASASRPVDLGIGNFWLEDWTDDGNTAIFARWERDSEPGRRKFVGFDLRANSVVPAPQTKRFHEPEERSDIEIRTTRTEVAAGTLRVFRTALWLSATGPAERPALLLSAEADSAVLAPSVDRVAILEKGVVTVRPIAKLPKSVWAEVAKQEAMQLSKQAALGLLMYATDYDDELPSRSHFDEGVIDPYLKDERYKGRFVYLFKGGTQTALADPSRTPLGYVPGPGGYAMAYADGHVEWIPGAPPKTAAECFETSSAEPNAHAPP